MSSTFLAAKYLFCLVNKKSTLLANEAAHVNLGRQSAFNIELFLHFLYPHMFLGKTDSEIHNIIVQEWQSKLLGEVDIHHMLNDLCSRYQSEKGTLKCKLRGERGGMTGLQWLQEYKFMYRQHLKASIEASYESACLAVAVCESSANGCEIDR